MATVVPAEGIVLQGVLDATHAVSRDGLNRDAYGKFAAAQVKTAWGSQHQSRWALVDGGRLLASATQYNLAAVFEHRPVRVCGIGSIVAEPSRRDHASQLVERLLDQARRDGAVMALFFSDRTSCRKVLSRFRRRSRISRWRSHRVAAPR